MSKCKIRPKLSLGPQSPSVLLLVFSYCDHCFRPNAAGSTGYLYRRRWPPAGSRKCRRCTCACVCARVTEMCMSACRRRLQPGTKVTCCIIRTCARVHTPNSPNNNFCALALAGTARSGHRRRRLTSNAGRPVHKHFRNFHLFHIFTHARYEPVLCILCCDCVMFYIDNTFPRGNTHMISWLVL
jgi:hypothetical protein